ncbi:MAG: hypothetical protein DMF06_03445 [Verrucomicrobia bacterium]|nr:MAG: hypothetical protein DMF06_03445 [Verrucomicrobiota bacterium]
MAATYKVEWNPQALMVKVDGLAIEEIDKLALRIIAASDPPIDTGFLSASAYVNSSSGLNTFDERWKDGEYLSRHTGRTEKRRSVDSAVPPPRVGAVAAWAADYAIWVEERTSFIYNAVQKVAATK